MHDGLDTFFPSKDSSPPPTDSAQPGRTGETTPGQPGREHIDRAIRAVASITAGEDFFQILVQHIAEALGVKFAFVGRLTEPRRDRIRTLAAWRDGGLIPNFEYVLAGTPCEHVVDRQPCVYPAGVAKQFPNDRGLAALAIESYIGIPLFSRARVPLGLVAALDDKPLQTGPALPSLLEIFSARAAAELERLETEQALRESEQRYHLVIHGACDGIWEYDLVRDTAYFSPRFQDLLGYSPEQFPRRPVMKALLHPDDYPLYQRIEQAHLKGEGPLDTELRFLTGWGEYRWYRCRGQALWDSEGKPLRLAGSITLIHNEKITAKILRKQLALQSLVAEYATRFANSPIEELDAAFDAALCALGEHMSVDRAYLMQFSEDKKTFSVTHEWCGPGISPAIHELQDEPCERYPLGILKILSGEDVLVTDCERLPYIHRAEREVWLRQGIKSLATVPLVSSGNIIGLAGFDCVRSQREWTEEEVIALRLFGELIAGALERKRSEEAFRKSELNLRQIIDLVPHSLYVKDADGRFLLVNRRSAELMGVSPQQAIGRTQWELSTNQEEARLLIEDDLKALRSGQPIFVPERAFTDPSGTIHYEQIIKMPFQPVGRNESAVLGISIDITELKQTQNELRRHQEHLEELVRQRTRELEETQEALLRQERLAAIGQITATVSHEIRNPLGTIRGSIFMLSRWLRGSGAKIDGALERAERATERCDRIIEELLDFTRITVLQREETWIDEWLTRIISDMAIPNTITTVIQTAFGGEIPIDRERIRRAIQNLVSNACQAMMDSPSGQRRLRLATRQEPSSGALLIEVEDTGPGIPPEQIDKVFEPLFSTRSFGVGLGLPLVRRIIDLHGGKITIESKPGKGTIARIHLPANP